MSYVFTGTKVHLTYKTHIDRERWEATIKRKLKGQKVYSFVHEVGDESEECPTPYEHTHIFWYGDKIVTTDPRFFDFEGIHPNWTHKKSLQWAKTICTKYHLGHKTKADGKKYFIEPIMLHQEGVEEWKFEQELLTAVSDAPDLVTGCEIAGVLPKSVNDVALLQRAKRRKVEPRRFTLEQFEWEPVTNWSQCVVFVGESGIGKTEFALAHFDKPLLVRDIDTVKEFDPNFHDGIVFDDMSFNHWPRTSQIHLLDQSRGSDIHCRHTNAFIPANTPKLFTCNPGCEPFLMYDAAIARRVRVVELAGPTR